MREKLNNEIKQMQQQANHYLELHQQAVGAVNALQWALAQLPPEEEKVLTEKQLLEAIERGAMLQASIDAEFDAPKEE